MCKPEVTVTEEQGESREGLGGHANLKVCSRKCGNPPRQQMNACGKWGAVWWIGGVLGNFPVSWLP